MAHDIWFISDTHFFHSNILKFTGEDGKRIRPEFSSCKEMDEYLISQWNQTVKPQDKIYHLGDVAFGSKSWLGGLMKTLHGHKRLIVGNHDDIKHLAPFFEKVYLWRIFKEYGFTCSHIPLREDQLRKTRFNVHGHIHEKPSPSAQHINVCVEKTQYRPVHLDEVRKWIESSS